jgi:hypothetical protein
LGTLPENWRSEADLRALFGTLRIAERADQGALRIVPVREKDVKRAWAATPDWPEGTVVRCLVRFMDDENNVVAVASYWRYPDGKPAASGRYDPKMVVAGGVRYWTGLMKGQDDGGA